MTDKNNFSELLRVPTLLSEEMGLYDEERMLAQDEFDKEMGRIEDDFSADEIHSKEVRDNQEQEASARYQSWAEKVKKYKAATKKTHERAVTAVTKALSLTGERISMQAAMERLKEETDQRIRQRRMDDNDAIRRLCASEMDYSEQSESIGTAILNAAADQKSREQKAAATLYSADHTAHLAEKNYRTASNERRFAIQRDRAQENFLERVEEMILPDHIQEIYGDLQDQLPSYEIFEPAETFPSGILFGYAGYDVTNQMSDPLKEAVLSKRFLSLLKEENGRRYIKVPYGYSLVDNRFSTMFEYDPDNIEDAQALMRSLVMNLYMAIPVNKCWCTFIDPLKLGDTFAAFAPLGELDESGNGDARAIDTKIWSLEKDIEDRLKLIVDHTADINQRCLQGRYRNILDYNADAGINAEPLRFVIIMNFPHRLTPRSLAYLESILTNGPKTGVYTLIAADVREMDNYDESSPVARIRSRIQNVVEADGDLLYVQEATREGRMRYFPLEEPEADKMFDVIKDIRGHLGEEIVITYQMISDNLPGKPDYWFNKSALEGFSVPIGMEGAGKIVNLEFGHPYHSFSALIGGDTGSGKSELMSTIIFGTLFNYSLDDVQIYLIDFKLGVTFKQFADKQLPAFRVIALETEQEFGYAVLNELRLEMDRRAAKFREAGVPNIESYWRYKGERGESHADMPRLLIIFDELQALLSDSDNDLVKGCSSIIQDLVTQAARAFGMHLILSTQTFENVKGLDSGVYSNIHTRIALKSSKGTAELLLDSDNEIVNRLAGMDPGQGVFNNNAGHKDANRTFRAGYIYDSEKLEWLDRLYDRLMETMADEPGRTRILLSGPEDDACNPLSVFARDGRQPVNMGDPVYRLYIGESLTIENTFVPGLATTKGSNLLLAGRDVESSGLSRMAAGYSVLSLLHETVRLNGVITEPFITVFDLGGSTGYGREEFDMLHYIEDAIPEAFRIILPNQILNGIDTLREELYSGRRQFVIFYGLNRAKMLTVGTYERSGKDQLEQLFAEGPENGMNFIVWANDPELLIEDYGRAMDYFDMRLAYGMEDKEYKKITGEFGPKTISKYNAVSYGGYSENRKIRMYRRPTESWLREFLTNIRNYLA